MDGSAAWLQKLPVDEPYVLVAAAMIVVISLLRVGFESRASGRRALRIMHALEAAFLALLLAAMLLLSFLQIVLRNLANAGFVWIDPLLRHLVLWIGFLGAMVATRVGRHINIDALSRFLAPLPLRGVRIATNLLAALVCLLLSNACLKMVREEAVFGQPGFLGVPTWILQVVMPVAMLVMSYRFLGHALAALRGRGLDAARVPEARS
ncbi:MAG: TRAP transporter small permease [Candidatus Krumholzibacteriia bacterium]